MEHPRVVLVLGAGASKPYGFPLGTELKQQLRSNLVEEDQAALMRVYEHKQHLVALGFSAMRALRSALVRVSTG